MLGWPAKPPCNCQTYVANRAAYILKLVVNANWKYISTHENSADLGSSEQKVVVAGSSLDF